MLYNPLYIYLRSTSYLPDEGQPRQRSFRANQPQQQAQGGRGGNTGGRGVRVRSCSTGGRDEVGNGGQSRPRSLSRGDGGGSGGGSGSGSRKSKGGK